MNTQELSPAELSELTIAQIEAFLAKVALPEGFAVEGIEGAEFYDFDKTQSQPAAKPLTENLTLAA